MAQGETGAGGAAAAAEAADPAAIAAEVLTAEGEALLAFAGRLPADFAAAVALILARTARPAEGGGGRVACSGIGKSGHVTRKIAATLASTGTPAFFVHPAEASHGDLGMVRPEDCCLLVSNSGETAELGDLIAHCARFEIPMSGISKAPGSTLMQAARLRLTLPDLPEACAIGMAPTTSTTLTLALGDALAVALMRRRAMTPEEYRSFHPGGRLGARLAPVAQLMHRAEAVPRVAPETPMAEALIEMSARGFGVTGVVDAEGRLVGVITDGDLRRHIDGLMTRTAGQVATRQPVTVAPETLAAEALAIMNRLKIGVVFVTEAGRPVGILHVHDCLRAGLG
jgi:arabinose-5-phosphate isomerase